MWRTRLGARESYYRWRSGVRRGGAETGRTGGEEAYGLFLVANRVNFREDAGDRWSASIAPVVALLPGLPVYDSRPSARSATRKWGSGQKEWAGEEALYRESSVLSDGRSAPRVVLANRSTTPTPQSNPLPFP